MDGKSWSQETVKGGKCQRLEMGWETEKLLESSLSLQSMNTSLKTETGSRESISSVQSLSRV